MNLPKKIRKTYARGRHKEAAGRRAVQQQAQRNHNEEDSGEVVDAAKPVRTSNASRMIEVVLLQAQTSEGIEVVTWNDALV